MEQISNPMPLGWIAPVPGTPKDFFEHFPELRADRFDVNEWIVQAGPDNSGHCYIGNVNMNQATGDGVLLVLMNAGDAASFHSSAINVYNLNEFRVDAEFAGDGVLVSVYVR